jgi:hypothetical protein
METEGSAVTTGTEGGPTYRFGPLERRGLLAGLRKGQVGVLVGAAVCAIGVMVSGIPYGGYLAMVVLVVGAWVAFQPLRGRTIEQWVPIAVTYWVRTLSGGRGWRNDAPTLGHPSLGGGPGRPHLPPTLKTVRMVETAGPHGEPMGVLREATSFTAVLQVRPQAFALCDRDEQARRLAAWGGVLAGLAREGSPVSRLQWIERTAPADGGALVRSARAALAVPETHPLAATYLDLVEAAGPVTQAHETFVAIRIDATKAPRLVKAGGGGDVGAVTVLRREVATLADGLAAADVPVTGPLGPRQLAHAIRVGFDPSARAGLSALAAGDPTREGLSPNSAWPAATSESWAGYQADGTLHATYWVEEWPRIPVAPRFLSGFLLNTTAARTVSVIAEPMAPSEAVRQVEAARTHDHADDELRRRLGFLPTARRRRQQEGTAEREEELADGHGEYRFSGYVTVSAASPEDLEDACGDVEHHAQKTNLQLTRLRGQQAQAFAWTLPLCRGLA